MALIPYEPFKVWSRDSRDWWPSVSRWFDDTTDLSPILPRLDVQETPTDIIVRAELPGLASADDVTIMVHDNALQLSGTIPDPVSEEHTWHRRERFHGTFSRTIGLPVPVEPDQAEASYQHGILEIRLPKDRRHVARPVKMTFH